MRKLTLPIVLSFVLATVLIACKNKEKVQQTAATAQAAPVPAKQQDADSLVLSFRRTACFGQCPTFEICVYKSGYATFDGQHYVKPEGWNYCYVDMDYVMTLCNEAKKAGFFGLNEKYSSDIPDFPGTITYLHLGNQKLKVTNNHGEVPEFLSTFEKKIDKYFRGLEWTPLPNKKD